MSRYTGPRLRKVRRLEVDLPGLTRKMADRRPYPPGQHGDNRRRKMSDFGRQLREKQKLRFNYGISERQLRRLVKEGKASKQNTGEKLLELLERRLDNAVFRAGFAHTIPQARQIVTHGHFLVNGQKVNIPSYRVRTGEVITLRERSKNLQIVADAVKSPALAIPEWLSMDPNTLTATVDELPTAASVPLDVDVQLVVEYYAQRL